jgi:hypothetical protein
MTEKSANRGREGHKRQSAKFHLDWLDCSAVYTCTQDISSSKINRHFTVQQENQVAFRIEPASTMRTEGRGERGKREREREKKGGVFKLLKRLCYGRLRRNQIRFSKRSPLSFHYRRPLQKAFKKRA